MTPKEVIDKYYLYANSGDWTRWCDLFADDIVIDEQLAGHVEGLPTLRNMMTGMGTMYSKFRNTPEKIIVSNNEAAVVSHISALSPSGVPVEANVMNYFKFENGKIIYLSNYHDTRPFDPVMNQGKK